MGRSMGHHYLINTSSRHRHQHITASEVLKLGSSFSAPVLAFIQPLKTHRRPFPVVSNGGPKHVQKPEPSKGSLHLFVVLWNVCLTGHPYELSMLGMSVRARPSDDE